MREIYLIKSEHTNIVFDISSSKSFEISSGLYKILKENENSLEKLDLYGPDMQEIFHFLMLQEPLKPSSVFPNEEKLNRLTFISSQKCNLTCRYCFESLNENKRIEKTMPFRIYKDSLDFVLAKYVDGIETITFFGGEPMIGFTEIRKFIQYCTGKFKERKLIMPYLNIITNGTCLTPDAIELFGKYKVAVTISIDGPKEINDAARISPFMESVFDQVSLNIDNLMQNRNFILGAEITLNRNHVQAYKKGGARDWIDKIIEMGFDYITVGNIESKDPNLGIYDDQLDTYDEMCIEIYDYLFEKMCCESSIISVDILRAIKILKAKHIVSESCGAGVYNLTIMPDGQIQPCHVLPECNEFSMGNIYGSNLSFEVKKKKLTSFFHEELEVCKTCWMKNICSSKCKGFGYLVNNDMGCISSLKCRTAGLLLERCIVNINDAGKIDGKLDRLKQNVVCMKEKSRR